jgi:hypothetical protein
LLEEVRSEAVRSVCGDTRFLIPRPGRRHIGATPSLPRDPAKVPSPSAERLAEVECAAGFVGGPVRCTPMSLACNHPRPNHQRQRTAFRNPQRPLSRDGGSHS